MLDIFHYGFVMRGLGAGLLIGILAPLVGIFLVLRRYSLIADTLSHVSLAGVAVGLLAHLNPLLTALGASAASSLVIDRLRLSKRVYGESALSIFLSGSLALAVVLIGLAHGFSVDLFSYLFGSILTVTPRDIYIIGILGAVIVVPLVIFFKELVFISFDEDAARVAGVPVQTINTIFIMLAAALIAISIPIIGILLVSALLVIPVVTALLFRTSFILTIVIAEILSVISVLSGIVASFYFDTSTGGMIVLVMLFFFSIIYLIKDTRRYASQPAKHY